MRVLLSVTVGFALLASACGGSSGSSSTSGSTTTGGTGGTSGTSSGGTTGGLLAAGSPCTSNATCVSGVCGTDGSGRCCASSCSTTDPNCGATGCDDTGACIFPASGTACGSPSCSGNTLTSAGTCNGSGTCAAGTPSACPGHLQCLDATSCATACASTADCVTGFFCAAGAGTCDPQIATGPCTENDACTSGVCGIAGTGHCCTAACPNIVAPCGTADCDDTGACTFADAGTACGTVLESCTDGTQQNPTVCDGAGNCNENPGTQSCTPYVCGANACLSSCAQGSDCASGYACDLANASCCFGLVAGSTLTVDSQTGSDATACCGIGANRPCQTLAQAMRLIDSAQAANVTLVATVGGKGGDWAPANEVYPIALGWGVELSAPGVYFTDVGGGAAVFDVKAYSASDTVGYASIVGAAGNPVSIGFDSLGNQTTDASAIAVEDGQSLHLALAAVNGSAAKKSAAITVKAGAALQLGEDQAGAVTGTVTIGNDLADSKTDGFNGIVCTTAAGAGCTVGDATLKNASSVVIEGQEGVDIDAEDGAMITLTSAPTVGIAPSASGFGNCASKPDSSVSKTAAILLNGSATMTFSNGAVQCISGDGFRLRAADALANTPTLTVDRTTIQNTEYAIDATAGSATVESSTIQYNYNGVQQGTDGTNIATVDLSGGGPGTNTVVCCNSAESIYGVGGQNGTPAVCVLNETTTTLNASDVNWDTNDAISPPPDEPDLFSCNATLLTCSCENTDMICTNGDGVDGMDAVTTSTGGITQTGAGFSAADCSVTSGGQACGGGLPACPPGDCCNGLTFKCQMGQICPG